MSCIVLIYCSACDRDVSWHPCHPKFGLFLLLYRWGIWLRAGVSGWFDWQQSLTMCFSDPVNWPGLTYKWYSGRRLWWKRDKETMMNICNQDHKIPSGHMYMYPCVASNFININIKQSTNPAMSVLSPRAQFIHASCKLCNQRTCLDVNDWFFYLPKTFTGRNAKQNECFHKTYFSKICWCQLYTEKVSLY